jgi:hypothetical protein
MRTIQVVHAGRHYFIGGIYGAAGSLQEHLKTVARRLYLSLAPQLSQLKKSRYAALWLSSQYRYPRLSKNS